MQIRQMEKSDIDGAVLVEEASFSQPWSKEDFAATLLLPYACYLVAAEKDDDGTERIVGLCGMKNILGVGEISNVGVLPMRRRKGIARALLAEALRRGDALGVEAYTLEVHAGNAAAIKLYRSFGFAEEGRRRDFYSAPREDALILWKRRSKTDD